MPIYEYRCSICNKKFEKILLKENQELFCPKCGSQDFDRILSRVQHHKTEKERIAEIDLSKPQTDNFYKDPRNIGLTTKARLKKYGIDLGDSLEEKIEKARTGKLGELQD